MLIKDLSLILISFFPLNMALARCACRAGADSFFTAFKFFRKRA
ncbi:hypothetical protein HMPREF1545_02439 [Oscillibacter sp. KLE 1728]|nr:hypothetical protein HMPREF1545_02439 [Oscillibacter sp. KLE 1728]ERK62149.1 hypothetical protein HMPREF1546_02826 [Oscillibacter sp. KLE 1745]